MTIGINAAPSMAIQLKSNGGTVSLRATQGRTGPAGPAGPPGADGAPGGSDAAFAAWVNDTQSQTRGALATTFEGRGRPQGMSMQPYENHAQRGIRVLWQNGDTLYGSQGDLNIYKSTDNGVTWTDQGGNVTNCDSIYVLSSGTLLAHSNTTGKLYRSTNDGATFTEVANLVSMILGSHGIIECPDGSVLYGDYGTDAGLVYKINRSTDDGATWTAVFTPPADPSAAQIHSIVWDHVEGCLVAFVDGMTPRHYRSDDNGATWTLIGEATEQIHPNWVAPMFFDNYIAWGYDSELGGKIARISRTNYYAGNWNAGTIEEVAFVNGKAWYWTFPVRPGVWIVHLVDEVITPGWGNPQETGSWAQEIYIVSEDGAEVHGGISWVSRNNIPGILSKDKIRFAAYPREFGDQRGLTWLTVLPDDGRIYTAVPASVGWGDPLTRINSGARVEDLILRNGEQVYALDSAGKQHDVLQFDSTNRVALRNRYAVDNVGILPELRLSHVGTIDLQVNGALIAQARNGGAFRVPGYVEMGTNGPRLLSGAGSPEGVVGSYVGSIYLRSNGGYGSSVYVKEWGTGTTGWKPLGHPAGTTALRPTLAAGDAGVSYFDTTLGKPVWWNGTGWVDATGATA